LCSCFSSLLNKQKCAQCPNSRSIKVTNVASVTAACRTLQGSSIYSTSVPRQPRCATRPRPYTPCCDPIKGPLYWHSREQRDRQTVQARGIDPQLWMARVMSTPAIRCTLRGYFYIWEIIKKHLGKSFCIALSGMPKARMFSLTLSRDSDCTKTARTVSRHCFKLITSPQATEIRKLHMSPVSCNQAAGLDEEPVLASRIPQPRRVTHHVSKKAVIGKEDSEVLTWKNRKWWEISTNQSNRNLNFDAFCASCNSKESRDERPHARVWTGGLCCFWQQRAPRPMSPFHDLERNLFTGRRPAHQTRGIRPRQVQWTLWPDETWSH